MFFIVTGMKLVLYVAIVLSNEHCMLKQVSLILLLQEINKREILEVLNGEVVIFLLNCIKMHEHLT